jgi:hypothetical protein
MERVLAKHKKLLLVVGLLLLAAALVWAAAELSGQANSLAQDSGSSSADMEMVTLDTIKKPQKTKSSPQPPPCDWAKERSIKKQIDANNAKYKSLRARAKSELNGTGKVSPGTKSAVMSSANQFKSLCDQYAAMWDACKCTTRAKTARKSGNSRVKSAAVLVGGDINPGLLKDMESAQNEMKAARREYVRKATGDGEISAEDQKALNSTVVPQAKQVVTQVSALLKGVTNLLGDVKKSASGATKGLLDKVKTGKTSGAAGGAATDLLKPVTTLSTVVKSMLSNAQALVADALGLATGKMGAGAAGGGKMGFCFVDSAEEE